MRSKLRKRSKVSKEINREDTCLNCPAALILGKVDFNTCSQTIDKTININEELNILIRCIKRPDLGIFEPTIRIQDCPIWVNLENRYIYKEYPVLTIRKSSHEY